MLPFDVVLHDDETLISFLSRLARANGLPGVQDLLADFEIDWTGCLAGTVGALQRVADLTDMRVDRVSAAAFWKTEEGHFVLSGEKLHDPRILRGLFRVCPACIRNDLGDHVDNASLTRIYARKVWALKPARICPQHGLHLVAPPEPGVMHEFCASWEPWLIEIAEGELDQPTKAKGLFEAFAAARLAGTVQRLGWADHLPLCALGVASEVLGRCSDGGGNAETLAMATDKGFTLLATGEPAILAELDRRRTRNGFPQDRPQKRYGPIHDWLKRGGGAAPEFDPLREILRGHIEATWPIGPGDLLLDKTATERRFHSVLTAAAQYDMRPARVRRLLVDAGLEGAMSDLPPDERLYSACDVDALLEPIAGSMSFEVARRAIGLTRTQLEGLIAAEILTPSRGGDSARPRFLQADIDVLCSRHAQFPVARPYDITGTINISQAARRHAVSTAEVYTRFLDGRVFGVMRAQDDLLWSSLVAPQTYVDACFPPLGADADLLPISQAAKQLFMTTVFLRELAEAGHFQVQTMNGRSNQPATYVEREEVSAFETRFITRKGLSRYWRIQPLATQRRLDDQGAEPYARSSDDRETLYPRDVIGA